MLNVGRQIGIWSATAWLYLLAHSIDGVSASGEGLVMSVEELLIIAGAGVAGFLGFYLVALAYLFATSKEVGK